MNGNHYSTEGKRLIKLTEYAHLLTSIDLDNCNRVHPLGMLTGNTDDYYAVQVEGDKFRLMPGPEFSLWLYRGQPIFHDNCKASIYRNKEYSKYILNNIKLYEFSKLLFGSPVVQRISSLTILENQLSLDFEGLAQHYGLSTHMLDFTRSRDIAMFFALCKVNEITNQYEPILEQTTEAVLYTLDIVELYKNKEELNIIGFQPLVRPYRQQAFSMRQDINDNLNSKPYVTIERIRIEKTQSKKYYEMFEGGAALFPKEIVGKKVDMLRASKEIDNEVIDSMFKYKLFNEDIKNEKDLLRLLKRENINMSDKEAELSFSESEIWLIEKDWSAIEGEFQSKIKWRLCADSKKF